ncbi:MAG: hypothetical protein ABF515_04945 [Bifidobacterium sp.]
MTTPASTEASMIPSSSGRHPVSRGRGAVKAPLQFISKALLWHDLKGLWALSLLGAAVMVISGPIAVLLTPSAGHAQPGILRITVQDGNPGFLAYQLLAPMVFALASFTYLDSSGRVSIMHSLPLTRGTVYRTKTMAGLILLYAPHLIAALSLLPFMRFGFHGLMSGGQLNLDGQGVDDAGMLLSPNYADLLRWFIVSSVMMLFVFGTTVLAATITGNLGIGLLMTLFINVIVPVLYLLTLLVLHLFLYGFSMESVDSAAWMHPLIDLGMNGDRISPAHLSLFVVVGVGLLCLAMLAYRRLKSEHAGNNVMFASAKTITTVLVTFVGSCLAGSIIQTLQQSDINALADHTMFFLGVVFASPVIFIITSMIVNGTVKVFTRRNLRRFGTFVVIIAIYCSFTTWDITGYERRIPAAREVASVSLPNQSSMTLPYAGSYYWNSIRLKDTQSINDARAFHQEIIDRSKDPRYASLFTSTSSEDGASGNSDQTSECNACYAQSSDYITFDYHLTDRKSQTRNYQVYGKYLLSSPAYRRLIDDPEYRSATSIETIGYRNIESASLSDTFGESIDGNAGSVDLSSNDARTLAKLLDEDYRSLSDTDLASMVVDYSSTGKIESKRLLLGFNFELHTSGSDNGEPSSFYYGITKQYTRSIAWLKAQGLYDTMVAASMK